MIFFYKSILDSAALLQRSLNESYDRANALAIEAYKIDLRSHFRLIPVPPFQSHLQGADKAPCEKSYQEHNLWNAIINLKYPFSIQMVVAIKISAFQCLKS